MLVHIDLSEVVIDHFTRTGALPGKILLLNMDQIEELIDAIPDENQELVGLLKELLKREGL